MTQMPPKIDVPRAAPVPPVPVTLADTGLTSDKVEALIVKTLYAGEMSGLQLSDSVRLPYPILEPIIERTRGERLIEVRGAAGAGTAGYKYALTDLGRERAREAMRVSEASKPYRSRLDAKVPVRDDAVCVRGRSHLRASSERPETNGNERSANDALAPCRDRLNWRQQIAQDHRQHRDHDDT